MKVGMAEKKRVVIVGAGFAGLAATKALAGADAEVLLIDRRNHHLFQPLLYQVATAALSPAQIAQPIRSILRKQKNCAVALGEVTAIDRLKKTVKGHKGEVSYDFLVVATGATHAYFGHDSWSSVARGLKSIEDATVIRQKVLTAFELAEISSDEQEQRALMTFVIVGGGPTGVEMAGAIAELANQSMKNDFRRITPEKTRVILAESGATILSSFPESLSRKARRDLEKLGVEVLTGNAVTDCSEQGVVIGSEFIPSRNIVWAAGVLASPAATWLDAETDRAGRVIVNPNLTLPNDDTVFVIGDTASVQNTDGKTVPGLAPAAMQQGTYAASVIAARLKGKTHPAAFTYRHYGSMATIGRGKAIADFGWMRVHGLIAWLLWGVIHVMPLVGFRNRIVVACDWLWAYFTKERGVRLITVSPIDADTQI